MIESKDKTIEGANYRVSQLKATKGWQMLLDLAKMLGPSLGILIDSASDGKGKASLSSVLELKLGGDVFGRATEALFSRLDQGKVQSIIGELRAVTTVDPQGGEQFQPLAPIYELHFAGHMGPHFAWLRFALEVQFGDFLSLLGDLAPQGSSTPSVGQAA